MYQSYSIIFKQVVVRPIFIQLTKGVVEVETIKRTSITIA